MGECGKVLARSSNYLSIKRDALRHITMEEKLGETGGNSNSRGSALATGLRPVASSQLLATTAATSGFRWKSASHVPLVISAVGIWNEPSLFEPNASDAALILADEFFHRRGRTQEFVYRVDIRI